VWRISSAQKKWGPALLPAPTAPSEGYAGVRNLVDRTRRPIYPLSILAHQLRRRFPSCSSLVRGARLFYSTALPEGSLVFRPARPAETFDPETKCSGENRPMFHGPSWGNRSCVPLCSPKFRRTSGTASRERQFPLPAPLPGWPRSEPESSFHCLPAEIGPLVTRRTRLPLPALGEAGTAVPIT